MIELTLTAGRFNLRLTWRQPQPAPAKPSAPQSTSYPMRVGPGQIGFRKATKPTLHTTEETR